MNSAAKPHWDEARSALDIKIPRMNGESLMANSHWPPLKTPVPTLVLGKISPNKPVESRGKANGKHAQSQEIAKIWVAETKKDALAIADHRGEILKFIGDGLLAIFPLAAFEGVADAALNAMAAAHGALAAVHAIEHEACPGGARY